jgi:hypothetical protein
LRPKQTVQSQNLSVQWHNWKYKNTLFLILSLLGFFYLAQTPLVDVFLKQIGQLGYLGAFITGIFFVSTFTVAPAAVILFHLADTLHPLEVALLAGLGGVVGDFIILRFMKDKVFDELLPTIKKYQSRKVRLLFRSPYFAWLIPIIGAIIIASPLPDEVGVGMMGVSKIKWWQFVFLTFILNSIGIFLVVSAARL